MHLVNVKKLTNLPRDNENERYKKQGLLKKIAKITVKDGVLIRKKKFVVTVDEQSQKNLTLLNTHEHNPLKRP